MGRYLLLILLFSLPLHEALAVGCRGTDLSGRWFSLSRRGFYQITQEECNAITVTDESNWNSFYARTDTSSRVPESFLRRMGSGRGREWRRVQEASYTVNFIGAGLRGLGTARLDSDLIASLEGSAQLSTASVADVRSATSAPIEFMHPSGSRCLDGGPLRDLPVLDVNGTISSVRGSVSQHSRYVRRMRDEIREYLRTFIGSDASEDTVRRGASLLEARRGVLSADLENTIARIVPSTLVGVSYSDRLIKVVDAAGTAVRTRARCGDFSPTSGDVPRSSSDADSAHE